MSEIFVYVEGASDQLGMRELFADIIEIAKQHGNKVDFYSLNGKKSLLNNGLKKAINILRNRPNSYVFIVPDLYPPNVLFPHKPPKRIVEVLFNDSEVKYRDVIDAPWILQLSDRKELIEKCSQNFRPFVLDMFNILGVK